MENDFGATPEQSPELAIVKKFEDMLSAKTALFFDVDEFEDLIDYYHSKNEAVKAIQVCDYALTQHPKTASLLVSCAQIYVSVHKPQEALKYLNLAESLEPFDIDLYYTKASIFSQLRKSDKAIENYKKALEYADKGEKEDILLQLAFENENINKHGEAIKVLKEALELNPENETALYELGFCFDLIKDLEAGKEFFQAFVNQHPYSHIAWYNLGITYGKMELSEKAIDCYDFAIAIKEDFSSAYFNKAHCFSQKEEYRRALECFKETLQFDVDDALSYYYIGESYEKLEMYTKSIAHYRKASELDEFLADAWLGIGSCYYEMERHLDGLAYVKKAIELDELNPDYYYLLGDVQLAIGFKEDALSSYLKVYELEEDNAEVILDICKIYEKLGDSESAMDFYCRGVQSDSKNGQLMYNFVAFLFKIGDLINALFYLDTALREFGDEVDELFKVYEEARFNPQVLELIEYYKTH